MSRLSDILNELIEQDKITCAEASVIDLAVEHLAGLYRNTGHVADAVELVKEAEDE